MDDRNREYIKVTIKKNLVKFKDLNKQRYKKTIKPQNDVDIENTNTTDYLKTNITNNNTNTFSHFVINVGLNFSMSKYYYSYTGNSFPQNVRVSLQNSSDFDEYIQVVW